MNNPFRSVATTVVLGWSLLAGHAFRFARAEAATIPDDSGQLESPNMQVRLSMNQPGIESLDIDSLGLSKRGANIMGAPAKAATNADYAVKGSTILGGKEVEYRQIGRPAEESPAWTIQLTGRQIKLISIWSPGENPEPIRFVLDTSHCRTTLLGVFGPKGGLQLPAVMHLPGQGQFRISAKGMDAPALGYANARAGLTITFPPANAAAPRVEYQLDVTAIYPDVPGIANDHRFDSFRRNWLNVMQLNPSHRVLANNTHSTSCAFCYYEYADIAAKTPPLADGLSALDIVRQTLDAILAGGKAYGLPAKGNFPVESSDTFPSMLIAAEDCVQGGKSDAWLAANYAGLKKWADKMLATDTDGDGLFKYAVSGNSGIWPNGFPKIRPSNWWDTIGFGHEDAYGNALAYRALGGMEDMARRLGKSEDAARYHQAAEKLHAAYFKTFYDPATGVIAGWRSADGQLHDYYFLFVNGIAIHYGLVPKDKANKIMDILMAKMKEVGYTHFNMGLPGNLITVALKDYVHKTPDGHFGGGVRPDNSDGWQKYENGGATGCFAYFTLAALYDLGRQQEADQILMPMLAEYERGGFEGRGPNGKSNDWRMWDGTPMGYEGFLSDNYYTLLAVPLR
jgi:hypothetical protein